MKYLEIRRHAERCKPGQHLNQAGVSMARRVGLSMGPFSRVITSTVPRAFETAIAMGFAVDEQREALAMLGPGVEEEVAWDAGFGPFGEAFCRQNAVFRFGNALFHDWLACLELVPEQQSMLIITHGGLVEAGAVAAFPNGEHARWSGPCGYCEGVRLEFDGQNCTGIHLLRVPESE